MAQRGQQTLKNKGFIKTEDIPIIVKTLAKGALCEEGSSALEISAAFVNDWSLFPYIAIDLKIKVEVINEINDDLESGSATDTVCLSRILLSWVDNRGVEATWDAHISVFAANIAKYNRGNITKDYVGLLEQLRSDNQTESTIMKPLPRDLVQGGLSFLDMFCPPEGEQFLEYTEEWQRAMETVVINHVNLEYMLE